MVRIVRLGSPRAPDEGLRLGTVRRPPRGVPKSEYAKRDFYDLWLPDLAPSAELLSWATSEPFTSRRWTGFSRRYFGEMKEPRARRLIALLAAMSHRCNFSVGCFCKDESRCHRSLLREMLIEAGSVIDNR